MFLCTMVMYEYMKSLRIDVNNLFDNRHVWNKIYQEFYHSIIYIAKEGHPDFLKFVGPSGQKITRIGNTSKYAGPGDRQKFLFVYFVLHRKCYWYTGTITVNAELNSASNDIYFLNIQLFPW